MPAMVVVTASAVAKRSDRTEGEQDAATATAGRDEQPPPAGGAQPQPAADMGRLNATLGVGVLDIVALGDQQREVAPAQVGMPPAPLAAATFSLALDRIKPALAGGSVEPKQEALTSVPSHAPEEKQPHQLVADKPAVERAESDVHETTTAASAVSMHLNLALSCTSCGKTFKRPCELGNHLKSRSCRSRTTPGNRAASKPTHPKSSRRPRSGASSSIAHSKSLRSNVSKPRMRAPNPKYADDFDTRPSVRAAARAAAGSSGNTSEMAGTLKRKQEQGPKLTAQARPWQPLSGPGTDVSVKKKKKVATGWLGPRKRPRKINRQPRWQCVNCLTRCSHDASECPTCHEPKGISLDDICAVPEGSCLDITKLTHQTTLVAYDERMLLHVKGGARDEVSVGECFENAVKTTSPRTFRAVPQLKSAAMAISGSGDEIQEPSPNRASAITRPPESWMQGATSLNITDAKSRRDRKKIHPHPERPERIRCMMDYFTALGLMTNVQRTTGREATEKELRSVHTKRHIASIFNNIDESQDDDMEGCADTPLAARVAPV